MHGLVRDLAQLGCREFTMLGGEFLLRSDWYEIAWFVKEAGIELQLVTNGLLVTPKVRKQFKSLDPQTVCVSIDGASAETYKAVRGVNGFAKCRRLLDELVSDGFRQVNAITTFNAKNFADFDAFAEMFRGTEIVWQVQMAHKGGERFPDELLMTREQYAEFVKKATYWLYDRYGELKIMVMDDFGYFPLTPKLRFLCQRWDGCPAGRRVIGVRANGDILPCLSLGSEYVEDNLRRRPLKDIWYDGASFPRFRKKATRLTGRCAKCPMAKRCKAGCTAMAVSQTGTMTETSFCIRQLESELISRNMLALVKAEFL